VLQEKILNILEMGTQAALLIDPDNCTAILYRIDHKPKFFDEDAEIFLDGVLKGWRIQLSSVWV